MGLIKEVELGKFVVSWLRAQHWDVYQEVTFNTWVGDIVATSGPFVWAIELKTSLSESLVQQTLRWVPYAHYTSAITLHSDRSRWLAKVVLRRFRCGLLEVTAPLLHKGREIHDWLIRESIPAPFYRKAHASALRSCLLERQKTFAAAGSAGGKVWTPFKNTCAEVERIVAEKPGCTLKDLMKEIKHHYQSDSTARNRIPHFIREGLIRVRIEPGHPMRLFPPNSSDKS
jgi:hypothetical protein